MKLLPAFGILSVYCIFNTAGSDVQRRRLNMDDMTKEDLSNFLESLLSKREKDSEKQSGCVGSFEEEDRVILRTRDSVLNGAEFIEAPRDVETSIECEEACCDAASEKTSRRCDLAVFQQRDDDPDDDQPKCFLFSCADEKGKDACLTSPNSDYKVLKRKREKVEEQLFDVASNSSSLKKNAAETESGNHHGNCVKQFTKSTGMIIRTQDSIKNGAQFLKAPKGIMNTEDCQMSCCATVSEKSSRHCDFAVFQIKDENPNDKRPKCYLFSCVDRSGQFICVTSPNSDYMVLKRTIDVEEDQLFDVVNTSTLKSSPATPSETHTSTTTKPVTPSTAVTTTTTSRKTTTVLQSCSRLEWQCDDGACVKVTDVCNTKPDCADHSDENDCELLKGSDKKGPQTPQTRSSTTVPALPTKSMTTSSTSISSTPVPNNSAKLGNKTKVERTAPQRGAVLPLALGLSVTACVLLMVGCRIQIMKKKLRRRGKPLSMEESDYLINGMYL